MSATSYQSAARAALPPLYAAINPNIKAGGYYGPENDTKGYPVEVRASDSVYDQADGKRLWELGEQPTGIKYEALNN